jgi:hypothetical protein
MSRFVVAAASLLAAACAPSASLQPLPSVAPLVLSPEAGMARIVVWRPEEFFESGSAVTVVVDDRLVGNAPAGAFLMLEVEPGPHLVRSTGLHGESAILVAEPDSTYVFRVLSRDGFLIDQPGLQRIDTVKGVMALRASLGPS